MPTRTDLTLARIGRSWRAQPRGAEFERGLADWLRTAGSPATLRAYHYAVLELWEWFEATRGVIPAPDRVRRDDAVLYARWLQERREGLTRHRLENDPDREIDVAIYDIVEGRPGCTIDHIRERLGATGRFSTVVERDGRRVRMLAVDVHCRGGLAGRLATLVRLRTLARRPSLVEIRAGALRAQYPDLDPGLAGISWRPDERVYRYSHVPQARPAGHERSCGNATRIGLLSSFWSYLCRPENAPGAEPLLRADVWSPMLRSVRERARSFQALRRQATTPDATLFVRLLGLTFRRSHGERALEAASAALRGEALPAEAGRATFSELRDRVLLLVLLQAGGPRADEIKRMRRSDLRDGVLTIRGKRGKVRQVPVPPAALDALRQLEVRLRLMADGKSSGRFRAARLLSPDAPLVPAIKHWGHNAGHSDLEGLSRQAITMRLRALGTAVGLGPSDLPRLHPHGLRRLYARLELAAGQPLNVVQANMGHASGATTMLYAEEFSADALTSRAFTPAGFVGGAKPEPAVLPSAVPKRRPAAPRAPEAPAEPEEPGVPAEPLPELPPPRLVRVIRDEVVREPAEPLEGPSEPSVPEAVDYWEKALKRPLTEEETAAVGGCEPVGSGVPGRLCSLYAVHWGEEGHRTRLTEPEHEVSSLERAVVRHGAPFLAPFGHTSRLEQVYCGTGSGLPWWAGTNGDLDRPMPIPSPEQLAECSSEGEEDLCAAIGALWSRWMSTPSEVGGGVTPVRGPTAAEALVRWWGEALETAAQVERSVLSRGGEWAGADASWEQTALAGSDRGRRARTVFREHDRGQMIGWFEGRAWEYRTGRGRVEGKLDVSLRARKVLGSLDVPAWYGLADPVKALADHEREELLDFVSILTGSGDLGDPTARFSGGKSRADLAPLIAALRSYEAAASELREAKHREAAGPERQLSVAAARKVANDRLAEAQAELGRLGGEELSVSAVARRRGVRRRAGLPRQSIAASYLDLVGETLGGSVSSDPLVRLALSTAPERAPLRDYAELLRVDRAEGTIAHGEEFKERFAKEAKTHSECVGRRLARALWELWRTGGRGAAALKRSDELKDLVASIAAFKVPCPIAMENELARLLGRPTEPLPVYEAWSRYRAAPSAEVSPPGAGWTAEEMEELRARGIEEEEEELRDRYGEAIAGEAVGAMLGPKGYEANPRARPNCYTRRAAALLPSPILLLTCSLWRTP